MSPVKASSFRTPDRFRPTIPGRQAVAQHLAHRLPGQPEAPGRRPLAQSLHIDAAPHRRIELHSIHPSCIPQNTVGMLGGPLERSGFPPPAGSFTPPRCGLFLLRRSHEGSPELACWAWTRVQRILEGKARKVAAAMRRAATVAGLSSDTRKPVDTCADYTAQIRAVSALRPLPRGGLSHRHRRDRRGVPVPGPRPDGVDRRPLAPGGRRGGPEAAGATGQRRLRCVLGLP